MKLLDFFKTFTSRPRLQAVNITGDTVAPVEKSGVTYYVKLSDVAAYVASVNGTVTGVPLVTVESEAADTTCFIAFFTDPTGNMVPKTNTNFWFDSLNETMNCTYYLGNTFNSLSLSALATGFSISGGTISKTLTVTDTASLSGANTGDNAANSRYSGLISFPGFGTTATTACVGNDSRLDLAETALQSSYAALTVGTVNSAITYTARERGVTGNAISVRQIAVAEDKAAVVVSAAGLAVTVQPGGLGRMLITGTFHDRLAADLVFPELIYAGLYGGIKHWTDSGVAADVSGVAGDAYYAIYYTTGKWYLTYNGGTGLNTMYQCSCTSVATNPVGLTFDAPSQGTGAPSVASAASSVNQVAQAVALDATLPVDAGAALVGDGTGALIESGATYLAGGGVYELTSTGVTVTAPASPITAFNPATASAQNTMDLLAQLLIHLRNNKLF